jgi:chromate transport protein ChrA
MDQSSVGLFGAVFSIVTMVVTVIVIASIWKVFTKAGQPGWAAIVPIYNVVVLLRIAGKPVWWLILLLVPFVNFVILIIVNISLAKNFGKGAGFAIGLVLLGFIFFPILGFGDARYLGSPSGAPAQA